MFTTSYVNLIIANYDPAEIGQLPTLSNAPRRQCMSQTSIRLNCGATNQLEIENIIHWGVYPCTLMAQMRHLEKGGTTVS
jgi:hypothetical protein